MNRSLFAIENLCYLQNGPYSFTIDEHEIIGLSGASGVGKTQLLRAMVETILYSGSLYFKGQKPEKFSPSQWRRLISLVPAESMWWGEYVSDHFPDEETEVILATLLEELGFTPEIVSWQVERLSTGERQRLALARALVLQPAVLLLDEPCSALDSQSTELVETLLLRYRQRSETALIWVSHDEEQLKRVADRCFQVDQRGLHVRW
ncbi:MAG: ATP-binding cassette domain-containing protein [Desulfocapsaceae bacterium]|nr:ATP-binding cassette domain-containing protein [Desulfocapsaceae bacterium]